MDRYHLAVLLALKQRYELLDDAATEHLAAVTDDLVLGRSSSSWDRRVDVGRRDTAQIRSLLSEFGPQPDQEVMLYRPFDRFGLELQFGTFVEFWGDLWQPSRDDLFVFDLQRTWALALDHQEMLGLARL